MVTNFGKYVRILRIKKGLILKDMADDLNISISFLSAMETGRRPIPEHIIDKIVEIYNLTDDEANNLRQAAIESIASIKIDTHTADEQKRDLAFTFARNFETLNDSEVKALMDVLRQRG